MTNRWFCSLPAQRRATSWQTALLFSYFLASLFVYVAPAYAGSDAPSWMHAAANEVLPSYDEKTDAVLLYSDTAVTVVSPAKVKTRVREAYKILRPNGRHHGTMGIYFGRQRKVTSLHAWCIPAQGKDYEVKDKEAVDVSAPEIEGSELISDVRFRTLRIPAPDPGNVVGYEYEVEDQPLVLQDAWQFQETDPVRESHYSVQLPVGWEYKASWLNYPEAQPKQLGPNQWEWAVRDVKDIRRERDMPPWHGVAGQMIISWFAPGTLPNNGFADWRGMGSWYWNLANPRVDASPAIKEEVTALTSSKLTTLNKMQAIADFVQREVRYVAIELGIGGYQPHPASEVFVHRYGDCKDKATLMRSMLREMGVESYHVVINTQRGSVLPETPAHHGFNHAIIAIKLPDDVHDPSLIATLQHPKLGRILFFDPTNEWTPFGQIAGHLQANYGLLVTVDGGELVQLPQQPANMNSLQRTAKFTLDASGTLRGDVKEFRLGDRAWTERGRIRTVTKESDRIKPIESLLGNSLSMFHITHASLLNVTQTDRPFGFDYSFVADNYAKTAGGLLLVRPRVLGSKSDSLLETKDPRRFAIEFEGPVRDTDDFEISIPPGYAVDDLPAPTDADYSFAGYHSKIEVKGNVIHYTRTFEIKELSVPVERADELKKFYRIISSDERNTAVLKPVAAGK